MGGNGPISLAIWRATPYCHANVAQLCSSLIKTRDVASLWRYGVCLSLAEGHPAATEPQLPPPPFPPQQKNTGERPEGGANLRALLGEFKTSF